MEKVYSYQEHRRAISFLFLGSGNKKTVLMENTGEQVPAELTRWRRYFSGSENVQVVICSTETKISLSGWTCQRDAQICNWGFVPALFKRLISFTMDSLGNVISWQSRAMNYNMLHLEENEGKNLHGKDLKSARMSKTKLYFILIKNIWEV